MVPLKKYIDFLITNLFEIKVLEHQEPTTFKQALEGKDSKWLGARQSEMDSIFEDQVWLTKLPDGVKPIKCKYIFKSKTNKDGNICVFKARLMTQGLKFMALTMMRPFS